MRVRVIDLVPGARFHVVGRDSYGRPDVAGTARNFTRAEHAEAEGVVYAVREWPEEAAVYTGPYKLHGARERFSPHVLVEEGWVTA